MGAQHRATPSDGFSAEYRARAGEELQRCPALLALQVALEARLARPSDEGFWARLLAAPEQLLPTTRQLLNQAAK